MGRFEMTPIIAPGQKICLYQHDQNNTYQVGDILYYRKKGASSFQWGELVAASGDQINIENGKITRGEVTLPIYNLPDTLNKKFPTLQKNQWFIVHHNQESPLQDSLTLGSWPISELEVKGKVFFNLSQL
jgi:hypothetical protein